MTKTVADTFRNICLSRHSTKRFATDRIIPKDVLQDVLKCTLSAPSGFNLQPWQIIVVENQDIKDQLAELAMLGAGNKYRTKDASAISVFCADLELRRRIEHLIALEKERNNRDPGYLASLPLVASILTGEGNLATLMKRMISSAASHSNFAPMPNIEDIESWSYKNVGLAAQNYMLAANSHDLATCAMEGFDSRRVKNVLRIPDRYGIPLMIATGYPHELDDASKPEVRSPRMSMNELVFYDQFGKTAT